MPPLVKPGLRAVPMCTRKFVGEKLSRQWPAVRTRSGAISVPVHPSGSAAMNGTSATFARLPPDTAPAGAAGPRPAAGGGPPLRIFIDALTARGPPPVRGPPPFEGPPHPPPPPPPPGAPAAAGGGVTG